MLKDVLEFIFHHFADPVLFVCTYRIKYLEQSLPHKTFSRTEFEKTWS